MHLRRTGCVSLPRDCIAGDALVSVSRVALGGAASGPG